MRVGINAMFLLPGQVGGSETYVRGLLDGLRAVGGAHEYVVFVAPEALDTFDARFAGWQFVPSPVPSSSRPARLMFEQIWLPRQALQLHIDVLHSTGYTAPLRPGMACVTSILDMNYRRHPEDLSLAERLVYGALIPRVARSAGHVITLTGAAKQDIVRWTRVRPEAVSAIYLAPRLHWSGDPGEDAQRLAAVGVAPPYVLSVAAMYPHKNLQRLVKAFPLGDGAGPRTPLVMVGLAGRAGSAVTRLAAERNAVVRVLGWVDEALLAALYRNAVALAFPSLYEGFGLPILEAMALGAPVVTSNYGAMAEVAGDAAELVDPRHVADIRRGLQAVALDPARRADLRKRGLDWAAGFTWDVTAQKTLRVYERVAGTG